MESMFNDNIIKKVWEKAIAQNLKMKDYIRQDFAEAWIDKKEYGKESDMGWGIGYIVPLSKGGNDDITN